MLYNPAEVTARVLNHFLTDTVDTISSSTNVTAYYRAVA